MAFEILIFTLPPRDQSRSKCIVHDKADSETGFHIGRLVVAVQTNIDSDNSEFTVANKYQRSMPNETIFTQLLVNFTWRHTHLLQKFTICVIDLSQE